MPDGPGPVVQMKHRVLYKLIIKKGGSENMTEKSASEKLAETMKEMQDFDLERRYFKNEANIRKFLHDLYFGYEFRYFESELKDFFVSYGIVKFFAESGVLFRVSTEAQNLMNDIKFFEGKMGVSTISDLFEIKIKERTIEIEKTTE